VEPSRIKVLVHRESILHSAVEYIDNSVIGEMSVPDMRMCVQYALDYPLRKKGVGAPLDLVGVGKLTFFDVDTEAFSLLPLAARGYRDGGAMCAVINAADEVAVEAFLTEKIGFAHISEAIADTYEKMTHMKDATSLEDILAADEEARRVAIDTIRKYSGVKN
jgi:1-deoxy-D-xylulose-5-phosphate reductoisomerase